MGSGRPRTGPGWAVIDLRHLLPRHGTLRHPRRPIAEIRGLVIHHTASERLGPADAAKYHVGRGWPGIGYHFWVDRKGSILYLNDIAARTNGQGGRSPVPFTKPNTSFLAAVLEGALHQYPHTPEQAAAVGRLWGSLRGLLGLRDGMIFGHGEFKDTQCPGSAQDIVRTLRAGRPIAEYMPTTTLELQILLSEVGPHLEQDGVFGKATKKALYDATRKTELDFETSYQLGVMALMRRNIVR